MLQSMLGSHYTVGNFGVCGSAASINSLKPYIDQHEFWLALNFQPKMIVIMLGTNDAKLNNTGDLESFKTSYEEIIKQFQALPGNQQILLVDPPPILNNTLNLNNATLVQDIIPQINQIADELNLSTVNVYSALTNHTQVLGDGVHPNSEGAQIIATQVYQALIALNEADNSASIVAPTEGS